MLSHHRTVDSALASQRRAIAEGPGAGSSDPRLGVGVSLILAAAALAFAGIAQAQTSVTWGVVAVATAGLASANAIHAVQRLRRGDAVLALSFVAVVVLAYGLASLPWRRPSTLTDVLSRGLDPESIPPALGLVTVGLLAWTVGFLVFRFRLLERVFEAVRIYCFGTGTRAVDPRIHRIIGLYLVGIAGRLLLLATGRYSFITTDLQGAVSTSSPLNAVASLMSKLAGIALILLSYAVLSGKPSRWRGVLLATVILSEVFFGLLAGMRSAVLLSLLSVALVYVLVRGRVPKLALLSGFLALAILSPLISEYRTSVRDSTGTTVTASEAAGRLPELTSGAVADLSLGDVVRSPWVLVENRLRLVDEVAMVQQRIGEEIPSIPVETSVTEFSTVFIPRVLWPGKPVYSGGQTYAQDYWGQDSSVFSSRSPTYIGEGYMRGGTVGVVAVMLLLGIVLRSVSEAFNPRLYPSAIPLYVMLWPVLITLEAPLTLLGASVAQVLIIGTLSVRWAVRTSDSGEPTALRSHSEAE